MYSEINTRIIFFYVFFFFFLNILFRFFAPVRIQFVYQGIKFYRIAKEEVFFLLSLLKEEFVYPLNCFELYAFVKICRQFLDSFLFAFMFVYVIYIFFFFFALKLIRTQQQCVCDDVWMILIINVDDSHDDDDRHHFRCYVRRISSIRMQRFNDIFSYLLCWYVCSKYIKLSEFTLFTYFFLFLSKSDNKGTSNIYIQNTHTQTHNISFEKFPYCIESFNS